MASDDVHHPSEDLEHGHILSDESAELQRDTFFFAPMGSHPTRLVLGLNQKLTPVTSTTLRRWAHLMVGYPQEFFLCPATVKPLGIMSYSMAPSGPIIAPDSEEPLPPGNYGWYLDPKLGPCEFTELTGVDMAMRNSSFEHNVTFMGDEKMQELYKFPADMERLVLARDAQRCRVTGDAVDIMLTWIVPPPWGWAAANSYDPPGIAPRRCDNNLHPLGLDPTPFLDLKVHFYNHNFTVDADDNYRIIILRDVGGVRNLLPMHLPRRPDCDTHDVTFFRLHLCYSMNFMLLGGDLSEKYPPHRILQEMDLLGVPGPGNDPDCEMALLSDPRRNLVQV
ncbi:hypothetical protein FB451DRAFT_1299346, partial [Mycena latifolia]